LSTTPTPRKILLSWQERRKCLKKTRNKEQKWLRRCSLWSSKGTTSTYVQWIRWRRKLKRINPTQEESGKADSV
jgi:hypothetical protein